MHPGFSFEVLSQVGNARAGELMTPHGTVPTPVFMPVGTRGSVKAVSAEDLRSLGASIVLGNTYHLYLRPGAEFVEQYGGLHRFMRWHGPILTDSGGYQASSLGLFKDHGEHLSQVDEQGVTFKSYLDGSEHRFTPSKVMSIQRQLGADIIMAFDEATPEKGRDYSKAAMERTHRWLKRAVAVWRKQEARKQEESNFTTQVDSIDASTTWPQALFGIIQGGDYEDLRRESAEFVSSQDLPGIAIGGATIGQSAEQTSENMAYVMSTISRDRPLYVMGVGVRPSDLIAAILSGADMFDCVAPTKLARTGLLYAGDMEIGEDVLTARFESPYESERLALNRAEFTNDERVIWPGCACATCQAGYSRAYLRHLMKLNELLYFHLASVHNLWTMIHVVSQMRQALLSNGGKQE